MSNCVEMVPNIISMKQKRIMISSKLGSEINMVVTKLLIPGIELIVLKGLNNLIILMADIF